MSLQGRHILVTAGPTHEPIDPVRVIANRSSGRQGFAIAKAAAEAGARVTLVAGPVNLATPAGVERVDVETAIEMREAVFDALPADTAILVAAVADWRVEPSTIKLKKSAGPPKLNFLPNPDILVELCARPDRPRLVVGFAAETADILENAVAKQVTKGADWILANDVSGPKEKSAMGGTSNRVHLVSCDGIEHWPEMTKDEVAHRLVERVSKELQ